MNRHRAFLLFLIALSAAASLLIVLPFLQYVLAAIILAFLLHPLNVRLTPHLGRRLSPIVLILATVIAVVLPTVYLVMAFLRDVLSLARGETRLNIEEIEATIRSSTGIEVDLEEPLTGFVGELLNILFGSVTEIFSIFTKMAIGIALVLFLVYYLLMDGERFIAWIGETMPLPPEVTAALFDQIDRTTRGVVIGHIFVAIVQGVLGGIGLYLAGIPNFVFWTVVMVVLALLPLIGAFLVWGPAAAYLIIVDEPVAGGLLLLYGVIVVSLVDNYLRPIVIDQRAKINPAVILVGVVGGLYTIGFTGMFIGPIVLGILAATLVTFREDFDAF